MPRNGSAQGTLCLRLPSVCTVVLRRGDEMALSCTCLFVLGGQRLTCVQQNNKIEECNPSWNQPVLKIADGDIARLALQKEEEFLNEHEWTTSYSPRRWACSRCATFCSRHTYPERIREHLKDSYVAKPMNEVYK